MAGSLSLNSLKGPICYFFETPPLGGITQPELHGAGALNQNLSLKDPNPTDVNPHGGGIESEFLKWTFEREVFLALLAQLHVHHTTNNLPVLGLEYTCMK